MDDNAPAVWPRRAVLRGLAVNAAALLGSGVGLWPHAEAAAASQLPSAGQRPAPNPQVPATKPPTVIAQVHLRGRSGLWNVQIENGRITRISTAAIPGADVVLGNGRLLTEGFVEHHIHLDKTLTADRLGWTHSELEADRRKYDAERSAGRFIRTFPIFRESLIKGTYTEDDVFERAVRMARIQSANGTTSIRTHCVVEAVRELKGVRGLLRAREAIRPYMDLQIALHPQDGNLLDEPGVVSLLREGLRLGADGIGGLPELVPERLDEYCDLVFKLAADHGAFVDMHVDQPRDPRIFSHPAILAQTRKYGLQGRVTASHSYSLAVQPAARVLPVLDEMRELGVHLSCSPDSFGKERVQVPRSRGVLVSLHTDNVRDPLTRGGKADLLQSARTYARQMGFNADEDLDAVFDLVTTCPGQALRLPEHGLREGGRADLVLFDADSAPTAIVQEAARAIVWKNGVVVAQAGQALW